MTTPINVLKPSFRKEEILHLISECLDKGWTGMGNKTVEFEQAWNVYTEMKYSHFLSSNTVGLHLALEVPKRRFSWPDDSEVITTPLTFVSTNHAILQAGLVPVFADVGPDLCLDPQSILANISPNTKALIFVGIGGNLSKLDEVAKICKENNIWLVLDAAHMAGTYQVNMKHVGSNCDVSVFSFQAVKNLPTADSGMICFADEENDLRARKLSWLGIDKDTFARTTNQGSYKWDYNVDELGFKYHGNSIMASIGLVQLKYLDSDNSYRRSLYEAYCSHLSRTDHITLVSHSNCISSRHLIQCVVSNRDEVMLALNQLDIFPGVHYKDNTLYAPYKYAHGQCPVAHSISQRILSLPCHLGISYKDVEKVSKALISIVERFKDSGNSQNAGSLYLMRMP